eukprot:scaffold24005_cov29-Tisochrysis_lutea.AAC.2
MKHQPRRTGCRSPPGPPDRAIATTPGAESASSAAGPALSRQWLRPRSRSAGQLGWSRLSATLCCAASRERCLALRTRQEQPRARLEAPPSPPAQLERSPSHDIEQSPR